MASTNMQQMMQMMQAMVQVVQPSASDVSALVEAEEVAVANRKTLIGKLSSSYMHIGTEYRPIGREIRDWVVCHLVPELDFVMVRRVGIKMDNQCTCR